MVELTLEMAEQAVRAAQARARELGAPMTVTVVDEGGRMVLCARADATGFFTQLDGALSYATAQGLMAPTKASLASTT